ncbi:MAG TPA: enoyl-CoA hydratase-related protein [Dehalococcoidia bacterium]|nr:enoyl-CoA hydratase-related protein [Dehalococcoidia bacterium]
MRSGDYVGFNVELSDAGIATLTFNTPERLNGLNQLIKRELVEFVQQAQMDQDVRVLVITGSGRAFCAGDDISGRHMRVPDGVTPAMQPIGHGHGNPIGTYEGLRMLSQSLNLAVRNLDKPTVAAINGVAIQTGLSLALACDFRLAAEEARLGSATLRFGLLPDEGGQWLLVQHIGVARTLDFLLRSRIVGAAEALQLGLVHEVVPGEQLAPRARALATELANGPQVAMRLLKRSVYNAAELDFVHALDEIASKTAITDHHPDAREGGAAFREKRAARFNQDPTHESRAEPV